MQETFGIEEEFMIADPHTLTPVPAGQDAAAALDGAIKVGKVTPEFLPSQIEYATEVCQDAAQAWRGVNTFRRLLRGWAHQHDLVVVPSGTPFQTPAEPPEFAGERYQNIAHDVGRLATEHFVNAMHVHVGISDAEEGVRVLNGLRCWLPLILALSSNSPFWAGDDTGHHSWRSIQTRRWTTYGVPPHFESAREYEALRSRLMGIGATQEYCTMSWSARLSELYPTVEVRVCDTQLTARHTVALSLIIRALAHACADPHYFPPAVGAPVLDVELWNASRSGLSGKIYDPSTDAHTSARTAIRSLRTLIEPHLPGDGSARIIDAMLREISAEGTGAAVQRRAMSRGPAALADLYRSALAEDADPLPETQGSIPRANSTARRHRAAAVTTAADGTLITAASGTSYLPS